MTDKQQGQPEQWLLSAQVADILRVAPKTVNRWTRLGLLTDVRTMRTLGGHNRYHAGDVHRLAEKMNEPATEGPAARGPVGNPEGFIWDDA